MSNIIDYINERGHFTFDESPLNEIDLLIFSQISYWAFEDTPLNYDKVSLSIKDLERYKLRESLIKSVWVVDRERKFYNTLVLSRRFSNIKIKNFIDLFKSKEVKNQFSGLVFEINENLQVIAYRGTDTSYQGWAESLALGLEEVIPAQELARMYLENIIKTNIKEGKEKIRYITTGHSKGGNLSIYASSTIDKKYQEYIDLVSSFDGPGFMDDFYDMDTYKNIEGKILKILPDRSTVGTLLVNKMDYRVVKSNAILFLQHDPFNFQIKDNTFIYLDGLSQTSFFLKETTDKWMAKYSPDERKEIISALFTILTNTEAKDFNDLIENFGKYFKEIRTTSDERLLSILDGAIYEFFTQAKDTFGNRFLSGFKILNRMGEKKEKP